MIRETTGDILEADVEALVNPVNILGVMGAGLALQFKRKYPTMFTEYVAACQQAEVGVGYVVAHEVGTWPKYVISFATKKHWQWPSRLDWIDRGLASLRCTVAELNIRSIAIPPLGCGLGGLDWADVRELIGQRLGDLAEVDVVLYVPHEYG